jgi:hypothetical protein
MSLRLLALFLAAGVGMAGCATAPTDSRTRLIGVPLAATHANLGFTITTGTKSRPACSGNADCAVPAEADAATGFAMQVQRLAEALQIGAENLYPDLAERVPEMVGNRFEVYVVEDDEPGSASSADGKIALHSGLGLEQPYDDWLAFVIAREMGHVIARHHEENSAASIITSVIMNLIIPGSSLLKSALSAGASQIASISGREVQAQEADAIAMGLLNAAGFRHQDVSLALRITPAGSDDSQWSRDFRQSTDNFLEAQRGPTLFATSETANSQ